MVVLVGITGFVIAQNRSSSNAPQTASNTSSSMAGQHDAPYPDVPRVSLEDAKAKFDAGSALIVDTRSLDEYNQQHIPGSVSVPLTELNASEPDLPKDQELILYCT